MCDDSNVLPGHSFTIVTRYHTKELYIIPDHLFVASLPWLASKFKQCELN